MARVHSIGIAVAISVVTASLTACGSTTSGGAAGPSSPGGAATTAGSTSGPSTSGASTSAAATASTATSLPTSATSGSSTVGALLKAFSAGPITVKHMPTADPAWVARVQTEPANDGGEKVTDPQLLNLMALVDEAAREKDTQALTRLCSNDCDVKQQLPMWQQPGALQTLSILIEKTHGTEGDLFPGFILVGGDSFTGAGEIADGKALGASSPKDYVTNHGALATSFSSGTGGENLPPEHWTGLKDWAH